MTQSILSFSLKSMLCSGIFVAYYLLALKNTQMNSFNRVYLLTAAFLSLLLPFVKFELFNISPVVVPDFPLLDITGKGAGEVFTKGAASDKFNWQSVLVSAYFTVSIVMVLKTAAKFIWTYRLKRKGQKIKSAEFLLVKTDDPRAPFSFMNMLFWPTHMRQDSPEGKGVLMHELAHIRQGHTLDKIFMELMLAVSWLNPFNWLIKNEVWLQHEFLADRYAVNDGNTETFARMLLFSVTNSSDRAIISPFFQSPVKRRLLMLKQSAKTGCSFLRRCLTIPVLLTAIVLLSSNTKKPANVLRSPEKIVMVLDAGHGGEDGGGKSIYGYQEKDITLGICKKLVSLSSEYNIDIITTRDEDVNATLENRLQTSNSTDAAIFLSIHVNKSKAPDGNSYELGINPKSSNYSRSILLASSIASKLKNQKLSVEVVDRDKAYMIRENKHPAVLIECGNLDDKDNIALLTNESRKEVLCRNILSGIVDYSGSLSTK